MLLLNDSALGLFLKDHFMMELHANDDVLYPPVDPLLNLYFGNPPTAYGPLELLLCMLSKLRPDAPGFATLTTSLFTN